MVPNEESILTAFIRSFYLHETFEKELRTSKCYNLGSN